VISAENLQADASVPAITVRRITKIDSLWMVVWNLPPIPFVQISLPGIPSFHFPCVRILFVDTCPPASDNGGKTGHSGPNDPDNSNTDPPDNSDKSTSKGSDPSSTEQTLQHNKTLRRHKQFLPQFPLLQVPL
jgi:hypothetical protein